MRPAIARSIAAVALLAFAACTDASSNKRHERGAAYMRATPKLGLVMATGNIDTDFSERLGRILSRNPAVKVLEIESGGGWVSEARRTARLLNRKGVAVRIRGRCASACALMWAATDRRELIETARIGLHEGIYVHKRKAPEFLEDALQRHERELREFGTDALRHAGFSDTLIGRGAATPHESVLWLSPDQLASHGVRFTRIGRKPNAMQARE